jgi:hypothetical protein
MDQLRRSLIVILAGALHAGCGSPPQSAWTGGFASAEGLAGALVHHVRMGDVSALDALALSRDELRTTVWPHLPASRPEVGMDWDYFWRDHAQRSGGHLRTIAAAHAGRDYELVAVSFAGRAAYGPVTVHREPALDLRTGGRITRVRLSGSMVERDGRWKLYSFVVD